MSRDPLLLPGVTSSVVPPSVVCDTRAAIAKARRRALARDTLQLVLLIVVDALFMHWPLTHIPGVARAGSVELVALLNAAVITQLWLSRTHPRWAARRIAATWCRAEQEKFGVRQR
jgi:hypothetical protein